MSRCFNLTLPWLVPIALLLGAPVASAQDALRGKTLYQTTNGAPIPCANSGCHDSDPTKGKSGILKGVNNAALIHTAIVSKVPTMKFLTAYVSSQDEIDIAAYLANPGVTAAPAIAVSPASITFASTYAGSASAIAVVTVSNSGTANLVLSNLTLGGTNAAEFRLETSSTCVGGSTLVPGASCRVDLSFRPTVIGAKSANLTIAHNATGATRLVPLTGTSIAPLAPSISVTPAAITFPATTGGSTSAVYSVTAANTGTAALTFSSISTTGLNANDFRIEPTSTCSITISVAPGASCRVDLTYRPTVIGSETASLVFAHNSAGATSSVALNGTGVAAAAPTIALSASSLTFGPQEVGTQSALQTLTVTNVGSAVLNLSALTPGGSHVADFQRSGSCAAGTALAASGGSCTLAFAFAPTAVGTRTSTLTIASNNSGGNVTVSLAGNATTNIPVASVSPTSLTFGSQQIGTMSAAQLVTIGNGGGGRLVISTVTISGLNFSQSGTCVGASLAAGQACTLSVVFAPSASGSLAATLSVAHGAVGSPLSVSLSGSGTTMPVPVVQASPTSVMFPGVTVVGQPSATQRVTINNIGPGSVTLGTIGTSNSDFVLAGGAAGSCAAALVIASGASCAIDVRLSPAAPGARSGVLNVSSNGTPSMLSVALTGDASGVAAPGISADRSALAFGQVTVATLSPAEPIWLTNTGATNLNVSATSVAAPFALAPGGTCGAPAFSLTPGQSCLINVQFAPTASGPQAGTLSFASNAGSLAVNLAGEAMAAPPTNQSVTAPGGAPANAGGGGALDVGVLLLLVLAIGLMSRGWSAGRER